MYIYESHLGGLYASNHILSYDDLYCEQCHDYDWFVGRASTRVEAWELLKNETNIDGSGGWDYDYVQEFIRENWMNNGMTAEERLLDAGYEDIKYLVNESYDDALIGVSEDGRAIYDFDKMVDWLMNKYGWPEIDAIEWIETNTLRALPYMGTDAPIVMYSID